jgi:NAD(P)-dependent dehydrogenase (short-subunit alcohol dehydrogenase family)
MARDVMSVNVDGVMWCAKSAGAHFRRQKEEGTTIDGKPLENYSTGSFIATASMSGSIVNIPQLQAVYNGSKAAVIHFCMSPGSMMAVLGTTASKAAQKANNNCFRQEFGRRVGWIRSSQHRFPWIHPDRDLILCACGDKEGVEGQDCHGVRLIFLLL